MGIQFRMLGPIEVRRDGVPVQPTSAKQRLLLAVLLVHANEVVGLGALVEALWRDWPPATATGALQNYVSQLRKAIEPDVPRGEGRQLLVTVDPGYLLAVGPEEVDAAMFERLVADGRTALRDERPAEGAKLLREALSLWRGAALADVADEEPVRNEAMRLDELRVLATEERVAADIALGRHRELVAELESLVSAHPLRERLWAQLMLCLYRMGRQADALGAFQRLRLRLADELGLDPSTGLVRLEHDILDQAPGLDWTEPVVDHGPLPVGTITMLFTDIEGSTKVLQEVGDERFGELLADHHRLVIGAGLAHRGQLVDTHGDAVFMVFTRASDGVAAAVQAQRALAGHAWSGPALLVRMGVHTGTVELQGTGYVGAAVNVAARVSDAANGTQILVSSVVAELVGDRLPAGCSLVDLGLFRLRDVDHPVHLLRVRDDELDQNDRLPRVAERQSESPAAAPAGTGSSSNLPLPATPLVGRRREIGIVVGLLRRQDVRLVTLTGPGGTGKTRVALQAAAEVAEDYAQGACFVPLAPVADPRLVPAGIAQALEIRAPDDRALTQTLMAALRGRSLLLLLDNFEQVQAAATFVAELLAASPQLKVLVTSRALLHLSGEHNVPVPPLAVPTDPRPSSVDGDLVAAVCRSEAVQLFMARAAAARPDFEVTAANARDVAEICRRLDGLPLALELAAVRIRTLSPRAISTRLEHRLPLLTGGPRDAPERLQTMRNAIAWSYDALDREEQALFRRLSVFVGGSSLSAAEAVTAAGDETLDLLTSLVDNSLVRAREAPDGEPRFWMLATLREYGLVLLDETGEFADLRRRHADWYLAFAEEAEAQLVGSEQASWFERVETEHDNLRAALAWSLAGGDPKLGLRLAGALAWFWANRGHPGEGRRWLEAVLASTGDRGAGGSGVAAVDAPAVVRALRGAGHVAYVQRDIPAARTWLAEALALARSVEDLEGAAWTLHNLGMVAHFDNEAHTAATRLEECARLFRQLDDRRGYAWALFYLAAGAALAHDDERAEALFAESSALLRPLRDTLGLAALTSHWCDFALAQNDLRRSARLCGEGLLYARECRGQWLMVFSIFRLARIAIASDDDKRGVYLAAAAVAAADTIGFRPNPKLLPALDDARTRLGGDAFSAQWAAGSALTLDQAVAEALEAIDVLASG